MYAPIKLEIIGKLSAERRLQVLQLPPGKRRQLLGGFAREIKRQSIRNLRAQRDVKGKPWEARKRGNDRKLLRRLNRQVAANIVTSEFVEVAFRGAVALQQHDGYEKVMTAGAMKKEQGSRDHYDEPATKKQAKALRDEGYKIRVPGTKKWRKPPLKWIVENLTQKRAGYILQLLRDEPRKKSWITKIPARGFLGATEDEISTFVNAVYDNTINARV